jgi:hypothetical protein
LNRISPYAQIAMDFDSSIYDFYVAGIVVTSLYLTFYWLRWGYVNFLPRLLSNCQSPFLYSNYQGLQV